MDRATFLKKRAKFNRLPLSIDGIGDVHVRELSANELSKHEKNEKAEGADKVENAARLAIDVLVNATGAQLLTESDLEQVKDMPLSVLKKIADTARDAMAGSSKKNETTPTPANSSPGGSASS